MKFHIKLATYAVLSLILCTTLHAQTPAAPTKAWSGNLGGGLAFTDGNSDTTNINFTFAVTRDPKTKSVAKWSGLYLRGGKDGVDIIDRLSTTLRDEFTFSKRVFSFGQVEYLRDKFKNITFLWSPTGGVGVKLVNRDAINLSLDSGLGGIWERTPGHSTRGSGAVNAAERINWKLSKTAAVTQTLTGWSRTNQISDALYNSTLGVTASLTQKVELKFEINDIYKTRPPLATLRKNDVAVVTAFVVKF